MEDFICEKITEGEFDFDFYILYIQSQCDDPYYPPYNHNIGIYKSKEKAIERARKSFQNMAEGYKTLEDRKYGGVDSMLYIEGGYFEDSEYDKNTKNKKPLYIIYDKEEQEKIDARWNKMHGHR